MRYTHVLCHECKKRRHGSLKNDDNILASPLLANFSNSFVENIMSNDENSGDEEPLTLVQSLRLRMDEMERESAERQKTIEDLPCMKRRKLNKKKRQINKILQEAATTVDENVQSYKRKKKEPIFMVITGVSKSTRETILAVVDQLGECKIQTEVDSDTTHVVSSGKHRTMNIMRTILSGCWLLSIDWALKSLEKGFWLDEEAFELDAFPAAKLIRKERQEKPFDSSYQCKLLEKKGPIFVAPCTSPPSKDILALIRLSGGTVIGTARRAKICIGHVSAKTDGIHVSEKWLLDSISELKVLPFDNYQVEALK